MVERSDRAKGLYAMIFCLLNLISIALLFAALLVSFVSLGAITRSFLFGKREPSTCFFFVCALCMLSVSLHSKPIPTWFRLVGVVTVSITMVEVTAKMINLMCKKIKQRLEKPQVAASRSENE